MVDSYVGYVPTANLIRLLRANPRSPAEAYAVRRRGLSQRFQNITEKRRIRGQERFPHPIAGPELDSA